MQHWVTTYCRNVGHYEYITNGDSTLFKQLGDRDTLWDCELALEENAYGTLGNFIEGKWEGPRRGSSTSAFHSIYGSKISGNEAVLPSWWSDLDKY